MKTAYRIALFATLTPMFVTGCLNTGNTSSSQNSVLVTEVVTLCGAMVGGQAEQRINQEWAKYPEAEANRPIIETMANVLLTNPEATEQQRTSQYKQYLTCATGLLMANGLMK